MPNTPTEPKTSETIDVVESDKSPAEVGEEIGDFLDSAGDLFRRGGRMIEKLQRLTKSVEKVTGPLDRPIGYPPSEKSK